MQGNAQGLLVAKNDTLHEFIERSGFSKERVVIPFTIDSIEFSFEKHYPAFLDSVKTALDNADNVIFLGGTDTLQFYSTLLVKDLRRQGYLAEEGGQKLLFVTSMHSVEDDREHVRKLIEGAAVMVDSNLTGAFSLSAKEKQADTIIVRDVEDSFIKISAELSDAFRCRAWVGVVRNGEFVSNQEYQKPPLTEKYPSNNAYGHVAPSLIDDNDNNARITYLEKILQSDRPFNAVVLEGIPDNNRISELAELVSQLKDRGTHVIINNNVVHHDDNDTIAPKIDVGKWSSSVRGGTVGMLKDAGADIWQKSPKDAYLDSVLLFNKPLSPNNNVAYHPSHKGVEQITIRYVPFEEAFRSGLDMAAETADIVRVGTLPGRAIPKRHEKELMALADEGRLKVFYYYDGQNRTDEGGRKFVEGTKPNPYDVAIKFPEHTADLPQNAPQSEITR